MTPDIVLVGHIAEDELRLLDHRVMRSLGGGVTYGSAIISSLGSKAGIVSNVSKNFPEEYIDFFIKRNIDITGLNMISEHTTKSILTQIDEHRRYFKIDALADVILPEHIPDIYLNADLFYLCPINDYRYRREDNSVKKIHEELPLQTVQYIAEKTNAILMLDAQGYTRLRFDDGTSVYTSWDDKHEFYPYIDILKINDVPEASMLSGGYCDPVKAATKIYNDLRDVRARSGEPIVIVTMGKKGSLVVVNDIVYKIPSAVPNRVVDPTGAGDTYGAAFAHYYLKTQDAIYSATMATVAASYIIECVGSSVIPTQNQIKRRYLDQKERIQPVEVGDV